jgi:hypothetical protein
MVTFRKILFPTDFNTSEACILSHALRLAGRHHGEVLVQHVVNDDFERFIHSQIATDVGELQNHIEIAAANDMKEFVSPFAGGDVPIRPVLSKGKTAGDGAR